ncbi:unnamed protein product [Lupinus luteus]|uniref:Aminotransferase-like plant mobile domain-containing protein n=1 Tax=Lupinus luteus TaxID=3873 RepID=A0AAV1YPT6_LUPLU
MEHIGPGPIIPSLLTLQDEHVSNNIWIGGEVTFRASYNFWQRWSQHLITTNIPGHATKIIRSMLDRMRIDQQHKMNLRGKNDYNWPEKHNEWIQIWNNRTNYIVTGLPANQPLYHYSDYMQWYLPHTRKFISPDGAYSIGSYNFIKTIRDQCAPSNEFPSPLDTIHDIFLNCDNMMDAYCQLLPDAFSNTNNKAPPPQQFHMPAAPEIPQPQSQTQTDTHPQPYTQTQHSQQQPPLGFEAFGGMGNYSFSHLPSSSQPFALLEYESCHLRGFDHAVCEAPKSPILSSCQLQIELVKEELEKPRDREKEMENHKTAFWKQVYGIISKCKDES